MNKYWIGFSSIEQLDSIFIKKLYDYFHNIETAFNSNLNELSKIEGLNIKKAEHFIKMRDNIDLEKTAKFVEDKGINVITYENKDYPQLLKEISNPPLILYTLGDLNSCNFKKTLAIVGSRRASTNGKDILKRILKDLINTDITIVSGLATGIDTQAHLSAIENNLKTIGVIASGFDFTYPESNKHLYEKIKNGCGGIISEYYPNFQPLKFRFPQRNRIVTGLSYGTLVVEAAIKSGALISANLTLEQGRELMCVPGLISNPNTEGVYKLLKDGATMVTGADDILNALDWEVTKQNKEEIKPELNKNEYKVFTSLQIEAKNFDLIQKETDLMTGDLLTCLTTLELKGIIKQVEGDRYTRA